MQPVQTRLSQQTSLVLVLIITVAAVAAGACASNPSSTPPSDRPETSTLEMLRFDPEGANFTQWVTHFKNELYRHWGNPAALLPGQTARVRLDFSLDRGGSLTGVRVVESSGEPQLDQAAVRALRVSQMQPLPPEFPYNAITMSLSFVYVGDPAGAGASSNKELHQSRR